MITPYTLIPFAAGVVVLFTIAAVWRRRGGPGAVTLLLMLVSIAVWCFLSAGETTARSDAAHYLWSALSYIGLCNVTPLFLVFAFQYSGVRKRLPAWALAAIWAIPAVVLVLAFTNGAHHLIWTEIRPSPLPDSNLVEYYHGAFFWVAQACYVSYCIGGAFLVMRAALRSSRIYVMQAVLLLAVVVVPWIGEVLFVLQRAP
ncbi:MAG TPA: histidine kinase N-terminal 7TM domain-containing protein, partial [Spirochaetia bacterium]